MHVPSPNLQDYLVWAAQRTDAGDLDVADEYAEWSSGIAPWTLQTLLDGVRQFGDESTLEFEAIDDQFRVRAGVETRPWAGEHEDHDEFAEGYDIADGFRLELEMSWDGYDEFDAYEYDYALEEYERERAEARPCTEVSLPTKPEPYRPATQPTGAAFVDDCAYVVWGDWLWEARPGGELREVVELATRTELLCTFESLLVLVDGAANMLFDVRTREFVRRDVAVPVIDTQSPGAEARTLEQGSSWIELPVCTAARIVDIAPGAGHIRVKDGLGRGGVFETGTWRRVADVGGARARARWPQGGATLRGTPVGRREWTALVRRFRRRRRTFGLSAFWQGEGVTRYTDNGLTFFEKCGDEERMLLVLDEPMREVSFHPNGHEVLASTDDALLRIHLDARKIIDRWRTPARLRYLRSVLPAYEPDEYIEQIVALWEVLADNRLTRDTEAPTDLPQPSL